MCSVITRTILNHKRSLIVGQEEDGWSVLKNSLVSQIAIKNGNVKKVNVKKVISVNVAKPVFHIYLCYEDIVISETAVLISKIKTNRR